MMMWLANGKRALATVSCAVCRPHLPKVLRDVYFSNISKWKSSSRNSVVHSLPTSSSKTASIPPVFEHVPVEIEFLLQSRAHFAHLIVQKCSESNSVFNMSTWKSSSCCSPVRILSTTFRDQAAKPRKQKYLPSSDHGSHFTQKNTEFRAGKCFQT